MIKARGKSVKLQWTMYCIRARVFTMSTIVQSRGAGLVKTGKVSLSCEGFPLGNKKPGEDSKNFRAVRA